MDEALKLLDSTDIYKRILDHADEGVNVVDKKMCIRDRQNTPHM